MRRGLRRAGLRLWLAGTDIASRLLTRGKPYAVLKIALTGELAEEPQERRLLSFVRRSGEDYFALINLLRWAREDERLRGVVVSIENLHAGWARIQGLHRALQGLRSAGKRVWVHLAQAGIREYFLATAADHISLPPSGMLDVAGLSAEATFFLGTLEKLGVEAEIIQVGQYKSAAEPFTRREMSPQHREMIESLVDDLYGQVAEAVAGGRGLETDAVRELLGQGPFVASEALQHRLVDRIAYVDQVEESAKRECRGDIIERGDYQRRRGRHMRRRALRGRWGSIGLLHISGTIKNGESIPGPEAASAAGATTVASHLERLTKRDDIAAIVLRIASPGGSGLASDIIWHQVGLARAKKPVVVSLGDVAASGGYYIAAAGAPVIAEPGTITGSIGVVAGKATLQGLYGKLGITKEIVSRGAHGGLYSDYVPLGPAERDRLATQARSFYADFVAKVASGRGLPPDAVAAVAEGRVWTGRQALERGLIDQLGGLEEAANEAKVLAGIPRDAVVTVERLPKPRRLWRLPFSLLPSEASLDPLAPWLSLPWRERVWAVLPFHLRFF